MTDVYWLKQTDSDVPAENSWLSASEALCLQGLRFAKRRDDWRLGRWTAKRAVTLCLNLPGTSRAFSNIEIRTAPSGAPGIFVLNQPAVAAISLSHRAGIALCAVTPCGTDLGCDLELIEPRSDAFVADYFSPEEHALVAGASVAKHSLLLALLWSAKESALKALHTGLRLDTRCVVVTPMDEFWQTELDSGRESEDLTPAPQSPTGINNWRRLHVRCISGQVFHGWWQTADHTVQTLVAASPPAKPIRLVPACPQ